MSLKWRTIIAGVILAAVFIKVVPNFVNMDGKWWPAQGKINYGLDIQGGAHLVMGIDVESVLTERLNRLTRTVGEELKNAEIPVQEVTVQDYKLHELKITLANARDEDKARETIEKNHSGFLQILSSGNGAIVAKIYDTQVNEIRRQILDQAISVIRNRIDEFGVAEPSIQAQGDNRILVQLPGVKDSGSAKQLINRTAHLEFRIVSHELGANPEASIEALAKLIEEAETAGGYALGKDDMSYSAYIKRLNAELKEKLPANTMVAFEKAPQAKTLEAGKIPYLLKTDTNIAGDLLEDAFVGYGERGEPQVNFRFGIEGGRRFGEVTEANVGNQLAIVLDEVIQSAPVIQSKIGESGVINLSRGNPQETFNEARLIATTLRAGALPAALEQLEERTVGPTLGADSIAKAKIAGYVAFGLIAIFMLLYYGVLGLVAATALGLNVVCLLALLTGLGATLTLPGIAGIILTMGMAVDSNVIIFERIKEEFRKGTGLKTAIADGFSNAYSAIIDSNLMGACVALILFYYGTGPVRGFAVTLVAGIVTSMFTAVFLSRLVIELLGTRISLKRA
jgi:preprotein translocase subunit SecD